MLSIVIVIATYFITMQIEKEKVTEGFKSELNKIRIHKIAEVWEKAFQFEKSFYDLYYMIDQERISMNINNTRVIEGTMLQKEKMKPLVKNLEKSRKALFNQVRKNSFYLGKTLEEQVYGFHRSLAFVDLYQKFSIANPDNVIDKTLRIEEAKETVDRFRANFSQVRKYIIAGGA